jgi:putative acetyltransferase
MVEIREVGAGDLEAVRLLLQEYAVHLNASVGEQHICLESYAKELSELPAPYAAPGGMILLALVDAEPAGVVALKPLSGVQSAVPGERACEMKRLWVRPNFRGLSLGKLLSRRLIDLARLRGYTALYLDTLPATMPAAYRIYTQLGFARIERYAENPVLRQRTGCSDSWSPEVVFMRLGM